LLLSAAAYFSSPLCRPPLLPAYLFCGILVPQLDLGFKQYLRCPPPSLWKVCFRFFSRSTFSLYGFFGQHPSGLILCFLLVFPPHFPAREYTPTRHREFSSRPSAILSAHSPRLISPYFPSLFFQRILVCLMHFPLTNMSFLPLASFPSISGGAARNRSPHVRAAMRSFLNVLFCPSNLTL